jgi:hypothetical protein
MISIFRVNRLGKLKISNKQSAESVIIRLHCPSTLKVEAIRFTETSFDFYRTKSDTTLHTHRCDNIKSSWLITVKPNRLMVLGKQTLFIVRTIRNTQIHFQIIYKNSVRTSQKTHCVSTKKPSRLMLLGKQSLFIVRTIRNTQIRFHVIYNNSVRTS